uniref:Uncharacterized protein n=1 Tax=Avena sativa TaxID=4498 RepID=A0ACD5WJD6_AVESA
MGNCAVTHEAASWADDGEWELPSGADTADDDGDHAAERISEVTIRISKRQLQELIDKRATDGDHGHFWKTRGSAASELLADIMNAGEVHHHLQQHCRAAHWKPALQSIPEAVES